MEYITYYSHFDGFDVETDSIEYSGAEQSWVKQEQQL